MKQPFLSCIHTHSCYCDGHDTPEEMVQTALGLGFVSLGFSGHGQAPYDDAAMTPDREEAYRAEVLRLRQLYADRLEILLGQEHDALSAYVDFPYDYLIESVHYLPHQGSLLCVDWSRERTAQHIQEAFGGDPYAYCTAYFRTCAQAYAHSPAQIVGHLDLVTKFNEGNCQFDQEDPRFLEPAKEAMVTALDRGMVVELNTGAIARGYRTTPYPSPTLLRFLREQGGRVIVTSDCHDRRYLTCWFSQAAELLRACGFRSTLQLRADGFHEIPL